MATSPVTTRLPLHSPTPSPTRPMIPRSQPPRPHSNPSASSSKAPRRPSVTHSNSQPLTSMTASTNSDAFQFDPSSARNTTSTQPTTTSIPSSQPLTKKTRSGSSSSSSAHPLSALSSIPVPVSGAAVSTGKNGMHSSTLLSQAVAGPSGSSIPQTGLGKMAAAAKARAEGVGRRGSEAAAMQEEEGHPLSEKALKARDYQIIHTLSRLFHLPSRWRLIRPLGQGAYGLVIQVQDSFTGEAVAVKCITRVFDKVILARRALREITLLRHFGGHENLTGLIDLDNVWDGYNEIYLYMEPMEADLHQIVRSGQPLSNAHIQYFIYQLLRGMKYIHSANVIHRDLKPGNLLVNADCELKICDFGLARGYNPSQNGMEDGVRLTEYVATRWYRAPEVMLSNSSYTTSMDVWSIGCILAEVLGGKPLFKGGDYVDQINLILAALGSPDEDTLVRVGSEKACAYMRTLPRHEPVDFQDLLPGADPEAVDLLRLFLHFDPSERSTVVDALEHPYVSTYHDEADEPSCPALFDKWEQVESLQTIEELKAAITREIEEYRAEVRAEAIEEEEYELEEETGEWLYDEFTTTSDSPSKMPAEEGHVPTFKHGMSPLTGGDGISPRTTYSSLPPLQSRPRSPGTPLSVFSDDSSTGRQTAPQTATAGPSTASGTMSGRSSRRTSTHSMHYRRPNSFLFSSGLGAGMTPLSSMSAIHPPTSNSASGPGGSDGKYGTISHAQSSAQGQAPSYSHPHPNEGITGGSHYYTGRRSRAPSGTGDFVSLRPLIRQLSTLGMDGAGERDEMGRRVGEVPPMSVCDSDAPPSEVPKSFAPT